VIVKELLGEACSKYPYIFATSHSAIAFSVKIMHQSKPYQGEFSYQYSSRNHMMKSVNMDTQTVATFHSTLITFSAEVMHQDIFILALIKDFLQKLPISQNFIKGILSLGVCHRITWGLYRHEYPYCVEVMHSILISFSVKIMHQSKFYQVVFSSQCSSRNHMVESVDMSINTMLPHHIHL
jgi:hypothetical protein